MMMNLLDSAISLSLIFILLLFINYYIYTWRKNNILRKLDIPGPQSLPFVGQLISLIRLGFRNHDMELVRQYGKIVGIYEGRDPVILLSDIELLRRVLIKDFAIFTNRRTMPNISGPFEHGLIALKNDAWKNVRTVVSPTFSSAKLKMMFSLMREISDRFSKCLVEYADKQQIFDCRVLSGHYTLDIIASCLFGVETNSLENQNLTLVKHIKKFFSFQLKTVVILFILMVPKLGEILGKRGFVAVPNDALNYVTEIVNDILRRRRGKLERRNDFIQIMVDHEQESAETSDADMTNRTLNDKEIFAQAFIFLLAGYETTGSLLSFFFYTMATEPEIQNKLYQEIRSELGDDDITPEKLSQLSYLDMVVNETLRMYPPIIRFERVASDDYQLGPYKIPKGTVISVPVYPIHHNPEYWPEPEKFIPERFSTTEKSNRPSTTFLPFGDGPRNCIGMRFALLEAKLAIVKALQVVEIKTCEKTKIPLTLGKMPSISSPQPIWLRFVRRSTLNF